MTTYDRANELVAVLTGAGINATADPRSAMPPCVLVTPPDRTYDLTCGFTARWALWALAAGTGNADAHKQLDGLVDAVAAVLPVHTALLQSYALSVDAPPFPAYRIEFEEGV